MRKWQRNTGQDLPMIQDQGFFNWLQSTGRVAGNVAIWVANNLIDAYNLYQTYQAVTGQTGGGMTGPIPNIPSIPNGNSFTSGFAPSGFVPSGFTPQPQQPTAPRLPQSPGMPAPTPTPAPPTRTRSGSRDRDSGSGTRSTGTRTPRPEPTRYSGGLTVSKVSGDVRETLRTELTR